MTVLFVTAAAGLLAGVSFGVTVRSVLERESTGRASGIALFPNDNIVGITANQVLGLVIIASVLAAVAGAVLWVGGAFPVAANLRFEFAVATGVGMLLGKGFRRIWWARRHPRPFS